MPLSLFEMVAMRFRRTPVRRVREALRIAEAEGLPVTANQLEAQFLAGGDAVRVVKAMREARKTGAEVTWMDWAALDLVGVDLNEAWPEVASLGVSQFIRAHRHANSAGRPLATSAAEHQPREPLLPLSLSDMVGMYARRVPVRRMLEALRIASAAELPVSRAELEGHFLAGGDAVRVLRVMQAAGKAGTDIGWRGWATLDLVGVDLDTAWPEVVSLGFEKYLRDYPASADRQSPREGDAC